MLVFGLGIVLFPDAISGVFNPSPSVIDAAHSALMLMGGGAAFIAISMILLQSLFGAGMTVYVMVVEMVLHFFCLIPLAYLFGLALDWGLLGIWGAALTYIVLLAAAMVWKFHGGDWKQHRI
jgi:Na+-driven multidrug efflux pump